MVSNATIKEVALSVEAWDDHLVRLKVNFSSNNFFVA